MRTVYIILCARSRWEAFSVLEIRYSRLCILFWIVPFCNVKSGSKGPVAGKLNRPSPYKGSVALSAFASIIVPSPEYLLARPLEGTVTKNTNPGSWNCPRLKSKLFIGENIKYWKCKEFLGLLLFSQLFHFHEVLVNKWVNFKLKSKIFPWSWGLENSL